MSVRLTPEENEKRILSQLENNLFSELEKADLREGLEIPIVANRQIFENCNLVDSWKSEWLRLGTSYPVPVGPGGIGEKEFIGLIESKKKMEQYLNLRKKYPQHTSLSEGIMLYAQSVIKIINESLSNLDDWQHLSDKEKIK